MNTARLRNFASVEARRPVDRAASKYCLIFSPAVYRLVRKSRDLQKRRMGLRSKLAFLVGVLTLASGDALAGGTIQTPAVATLDLGRIVLPSNASSQITISPSGAVTVNSGGAILLDKPVSVVMPTVTVRCVNSSGNGCRGESHPVTITIVGRVAGRLLTINSLAIPTLTAPSGTTISSVAPVGSNAYMFTVTSAQNSSGASAWTLNFTVGMTFTISGAATAAQTKWRYNVESH